MNEDGRCFPEHSRCPNGYHGHEDDESGECISNNTPCSQGYVMTVMANGGFNCEQNSNNGSSSSSSNNTSKTIVVNPSSPTTTANTTATAADVSNCKIDGTADGILQEFDIAKYQACKLHTNNDKVYYDGFVAGCMNVGNTKFICEIVADNSILNTKTQPTQTQTEEA